MKFSMIFSMLTISFGLLSMAKADELPTRQESVAQVPAAEVKSESNFSGGIGLETTSFVYEEPSLMKQTGRLNGFNLIGQYRINSDFGINANVNYLAGQANYEGSTWSGTPVTSVDSYKILDISANGLLLTDLTTNVQTSFIFGIGRRTMTDANDGSLGDYQREHLYNYFSLGFQVKIPHSDISSTTPYFGFENMLSGTTKTNLSDVDSNLPDLEMKFKGGNALKVGINYNHKLDFGTFFGGVNYKKWTLKDSEAKAIYLDGDRTWVVEPANSTTTIAFDAGLIF